MVHFPCVVLVCVIARLVQSGAACKTRRSWFPRPVFLRILRRRSPAGHAGDRARNRSERLLRRLSMLFTSSRCVFFVRSREAPDADAWHLRRVLQKNRVRSK